MSKTVQTTCDKLSAEPLLQMSLHSKELFHSNVLAWFCERYPQEAHVALRNWAPKRDSDIHRIQREKLNLDLVIELPGLAPVVIENKVFSPPDESQLERYAEKVRRKKDLREPTFLLLSLTNPNWKDSRYVTESGAEWHYVSYQDLADALSESAPAVPGFPGEILSHYILFISLLHELVEDLATPGPGEPIGITSSAGEFLQSVRMKDAVEKLRARSVAASIHRAMTPVLKRTPVKYKADYTNGQPLLEAFIECRNGDRIGWQYQGDQWRLAIITKKNVGRSKAERESRHKTVAKKYAKWFDFSQINSLIGREVSDVPRLEAAGRYCGYNPDFVYRYRKLPNLTLTEMETLSRHYLTEAKKWT